MPNIRDHANALGEQPFHARPFDEIDSLILTQIVYMPMEGLLKEGESATVSALWDFLREQFPEGFQDPFQQARYELTRDCAMQPRYGDLRLHSYCNEIDHEREMQFAACAFDLPGEETYLAFRGTDMTLVGWKEDLNMSFMTVPAQREAVAYTQRIAEQSPRSALLLGGHSKGGNLAVFAGVWVDERTRERIRLVYSFDGPGMDQETLSHAAYGEISPRIESYLPQSSVVGMLLHYHPVYTVVQSASNWILQHDAMTWQVVDGAFVRLRELDIRSRLTNETVHTWLKHMDMHSRKLIVDTLYEVLSVSQGDSLEGLITDWHQGYLNILVALRELEPEMRKNVRRLLGSLLSAGALGVIRGLLTQALPHRDQPSGNGDEPESPPEAGEILQILDL